MLLNWLPDETLYSLCCREHYVSGNIYHADTCIKLFDHPYAGSRTDFPARLDALVKNSQGVLGSTHEIITNHTILPFFLHWRSEQFKSQILNSASESNTRGVVSTKYRLGIASSSFPSKSPLKACQACMKEDEEKYSTPYWHLSHQYPGVWCCETHNLLLQELSIDHATFRKKIWQLPSSRNLKALSIDEKILTNTTTLIKISKLSSICQSFGRLPLEVSIEPTTLLTTYNQALKTLNLRTATKLLLTEMANNYFLAIQHLTNIPELSALPLTEQEAKSQLATLFNIRPSNTHPLRHLCLIYFLYDSWELFWTAYNNNLNNPKPANEETPSEPTTTPKIPSDLCDKISVLKSTINCTSREAAALLGVNVETLIIHAERGGTPLPKRPKKLKPMIRTAILNDLRECMDIRKVSSLHGVSIKTLTTLLRANPTIQMVRKNAQQEKSVALYRQRWSDNIQQHNKATVRELRKIDTQAYTWLYRHDRKWLACINKTIKTTQKNNRETLWKSRDNTLSSLLTSIIHLLQKNDSLSLTSILNHIPRLEKNIRNLAKLPKTYEILTNNKIISKNLQS